MPDHEKLSQPQAVALEAPHATLAWMQKIHAQLLKTEAKMEEQVFPPTGSSFTVSVSQPQNAHTTESQQTGSAELDTYVAEWHPSGLGLQADNASQVNFLCCQ